MEYGPDGNTNTNTNTRNFYGEAPREIAARQVFPILVQLATDSTRPTITYGDLADRIVQYIPDGLRDQTGRKALWMRYPLGDIWQRLFEYQQGSNREIPYLTTIVVNEGTDVPTIFKKNFNWSNERIRDEQRKVYEFEYWTDILREIM